MQNTLVETLARSTQTEREQFVLQLVEQYPTLAATVTHHIDCELQDRAYKYLEAQGAVTDE